MTFLEIKDAIAKGEYSTENTAIKNYVEENPTHEEALLLYVQMLNADISQASYNGAKTDELFRELFIATEQLLEINPANEDIKLLWMQINTNFSFAQTDIERFRKYIVDLQDIPKFRFNVLQCEIDLARHEGDKENMINLHYAVLEAIDTTFESRIKRDQYVSIYVYYLMVLLLDEDSIREKEAYDLIQKYVGRLVYDGTYPILVFMRMAMKNKDFKLIDDLAHQLMPIIYNDYEIEEHDKELQAIGKTALAELGFSDAVANMFLNLTFQIEGEDIWAPHMKRLFKKYPDSAYLQYAYGVHCAEMGNHEDAVRYLENTLFKPYVETDSVSTYLLSYYEVYEEIPELDVPDFGGSSFKATTAALELEEIYDNLEDEEMSERIVTLIFKIFKRAIQLIEEYELMGAFRSSALMSSHNIAMSYHNYAYFANEMEVETELALSYCLKSKDYSTFMAQDMVHLSLLMHLERHEEALEMVTAHLSRYQKDHAPNDYCMHKFQESVLLDKVGRREESYEAYQEAKEFMFDFLQENGRKKFDRDILHAAFEADEAVFSYLEGNEEFKSYTTQRYYQFFPKDVDVLYHMCKMFIMNGLREDLMIYAPLYIEEFQENDFSWNDEFMAVMERYLPELYKTDPEEVAYWLNGFVDEEYEEEWIPRYVAAYIPQEKPAKKGLFGKLFG